MTSRSVESLVGKKFNMLVVLEEVKPYSNPNTGVKHRRFKFMCDCGKTTEAKIASVKYGSPKSCGCLLKLLGRNLKKHGEYKTRIYQCWQNMKARAKSREDCNVCKEWKTFPPFKKWSLENGYSGNLILCRIGDSGDYSPENVRWDTRQSNNEEANCLRWEAISPDGESFTFNNLSKFCKEQGLHSGCMGKVASGVFSQHKGWFCSKLQVK